MIQLSARSDGPVVLALRALKLGDLLVAVPAVRGLRRAHPLHRLVLAVPGWLTPVVRLIGGVDAVLATPGLAAAFPEVPARVAVAANLHGDGPESAAMVASLGAPTVVAHAPHGRPRRLAPAWRRGGLERERWVRLVEAFGMPADPLDLRLAAPPVASGAPGAAVLHIGAAHGSRLWPDDRFADVGRSLAERGLDVVVTGGERERARAARVASLAGLPAASVLAGSLDLEALAATIREARVVVSADTGAAHLASAYATPSVVLFGPAPPEEWGPPPGPHRVLTHAGLRRGDAFASRPDPALLAVTADEVLDAIADVLESSDGDRARA